MKKSKVKVIKEFIQKNLDSISHQNIEIHNLLVDGELTIENSKKIAELLEDNQIRIAQLKEYTIMVKAIDNKKGNTSLLTPLILFLISYFFPILGILLFTILATRNMKGNTNILDESMIEKLNDEERIFGFKQELFRQKLLRMATFKSIEPLYDTEEKKDELSYIALQANEYIQSYINGYSIDINNYPNIEQVKNIAIQILQFDLKTDGNDLTILLEMAKAKALNQELTKKRTFPKY